MEKGVVEGLDKGKQLGCVAKTLEFRLKQKKNSSTVGSMSNSERRRDEKRGTGLLNREILKALR